MLAIEPARGDDISLLPWRDLYKVAAPALAFLSLWLIQMPSVNTLRHIREVGGDVAAAEPEDLSRPHPAEDCELYDQSLPKTQYFK
jgi:hypothetical protein